MGSWCNQHAPRGPGDTGHFFAAGKLHPIRACATLHPCMKGNMMRTVHTVGSRGASLAASACCGSTPPAADAPALSAATRRRLLAIHMNALDVPTRRRRKRGSMLTAYVLLAVAAVVFGQGMMR